MSEATLTLGISYEQSYSLTLMRLGYFKDDNENNNNYNNNNNNNNNHNHNHRNKSRCANSMKFSNVHHKS